MSEAPLPLAELREMFNDSNWSIANPGNKHRHLHAERIANLEAMRAIAEESQLRGADVPLRADERRRFDVHSTAVQLIDLELQKPDPGERAHSDAAAFRAANSRIFGDRMGAYESEDREQEMCRAFLSGEGPRQLRIPMRTAMREREMIRAGRDPEEVRALLWDTGSVGSGVPTLMARTLYEVLEANVAMLRMPTTKVPTETGASMDFPRLSTHTLGTQVIAQGTAVGGTDPAFSRRPSERSSTARLSRCRPRRSRTPSSTSPR